MFGKGGRMTSKRLPVFGLLVLALMLISACAGGTPTTTTLPKYGVVVE